MPRSKEAFDAMRDSTRQKIEAAALGLFARRGLSVTVGQIARAAGVSQGLLYSHYPSKEALIAELVRQATSISGQSVAAIAAGEGDAASKIRGMTAMMSEMFASQPIGVDYFLFMLQVGVSGPPPEGEGYTEAAPNPAESLARVIAQGQAEGTAAPGDPFQLAITYWAAILGLCAYAIMGTPAAPDPDTLNRLLLN
jgi:AcrR family transcriptional regulator